MLICLTEVAACSYYLFVGAVYKLYKCSCLFTWRDQWHYGHCKHCYLLQPVLTNLHTICIICLHTLCFPTMSDIS